jgi:hypothetical protein
VDVKLLQRSTMRPGKIELNSSPKPKPDFMKYVRSLTCLFLSILCLPAIAQKVEPNKEIIKAHSLDDLPADMGYRYPKFTQGQVYFKDGTRSTAHFNYNLFLGEMQYLDAKGDTLSIANEKDINYVAVATDTFYLNKGVFEVAGDYAYVKLAVKQTLRYTDNEKIGAYGIPSSSASISSMSIVDNNQRSYKLRANENSVYAKEKFYYLIVKANNQALPATKQNVLKSFSRSRDKIEDYISANEINFKSEADLKKLLEFCTQEVSKEGSKKKKN